MATALHHALASIWEANLRSNAAAMTGDVAGASDTRTAGAAMAAALGCSAILRSTVPVASILKTGNDTNIPAGEGNGGRPG